MVSWHNSRYGEIAHVDVWLHMIKQSHERISIDEMGIGLADCISEQLKTEGDIRKCFGRGEPILVRPDIPFPPDDEDEISGANRTRFSECWVCGSNEHQKHRLIVFTDELQTMVPKNSVIDYLVRQIHLSPGCIDNIQLHGSEFSMRQLGFISGLRMTPSQNISSFVSGLSATGPSNPLVLELFIHFGLGPTKGVHSICGYQPRR